jgi:GAF domain-containing protein
VDRSVASRLRGALEADATGAALDSSAQTAWAELRTVDGVAVVVLRAGSSIARGFAPVPRADGVEHLARADPAVTAVALTGEPVEIRDLWRDPRWPAGRRHLGGYGYSSLLCVPARRKGSCAAITLYSTRRRRFSSDEFVDAAQFVSLMVGILSGSAGHQTVRETLRPGGAVAPRGGRDDR